MRHFQVAIIGGGPGGYTAGIRLQQYGIDCVVIEKERLGGVCLNWGCIPTKALVKIADLYSEIKEREKKGIFLGEQSFSYQVIAQYKSDAVEKLVSGIEYLYEKRDIPVIYSMARRIIRENNKFVVHADNEICSCNYLILATGSKPKAIPGINFNGIDILSSRDILELKDLPESLAVIGGGVIGCEFASIFQQLGVKVQIVEFLPNLVAQEDKEISKRLQILFKKKKVKIHTKSEVKTISKRDGQMVINFASGKKIYAQKVLMSAGRYPICDLEFEGFQINTKNNFVTIDDRMRTNIENVFAIGDITGKLMLAHTASKQAMLVVEMIKNKLKNKDIVFKKLNYSNIPRCTFTNPSIGSVGLTEDQAREKYGEISIGKFMFSANGKALASGTTDGFVKVIVEKNSGRIRGIHIIGPEAAELIAEGSILINLEAGIDQIRQLVFAHPTLSETLAEAIEDTEGLSLHKI